LKFAISATGVKSVEDTVYVTINDPGACRVSVFKGDGVEGVVSLGGHPCTLVWGSREGLLVSCGEALYLVRGKEAKPVLRARPGNWFWHAVKGDGRLFVHKYGESLTGIYVTEDLESFKKVSTNVDVDPRSRHFHYLAFDDSKELLIATLGDGNIVRVAVSQDYGYTWKPLYKGPWQFVPILINGDKWIFGFDSGIARGGIGVYSTKRDEWNFTFLKPVNYYNAQFTSLIKFDDYYIGCLDSPTAVAVSKDLKYWYPLHIDSSITEYNHFVNVEIWKEKIVAVTGRELLIFDINDLKQALRSKPILTPYKAFLDKVKGLSFTIKRIQWMLET
jgi:hypothetical protein